MIHETIKELVGFAIMDGQNQVHDLRDKKATPEEITERMEQSAEFHTRKILLAISLEISTLVAHRAFSEDI